MLSKHLGIHEVGVKPNLTIFGLGELRNGKYFKSAVPNVQINGY
jgi:hypothetical protein